MKILLFHITLFTLFNCYSQDTIQLYVSPNGYQKIMVRNKLDTLIIGLLPNGKIDTKTKANTSNTYYNYERFYPNGKKMWELSYFGLIQDGPSVFYNEQGKKIITIHYAKGIAIDTISHSAKQTVFFGNYCYSSIVYGGMENEDGSSNVQEIEGPGVFQHLKLVAYPTVKSTKPFPITKTTSDCEGNFLFVVPRKKQNYGLFPDYYLDKNIVLGMPCPPSEMTMSGSNNWNLTQELKTEITTSFIQTALKSASIGYAP